MYVIYNLQTTQYLRVLRNRHWQEANYYSTESAAKAGLTRAANRELGQGREFNQSEWGILPMQEFVKIEKQVTKRNLMSGEEFTQSVNTPIYCDPSSETYWSM